MDLNWIRLGGGPCSLYAFVGMIHSVSVFSPPLDNI